MNMTYPPCRECYETQVVLWRNQEMNETLKEYVDTYISPVKMYHLTLEDALDAWGQDFNAEEFT